MTMDFTHVAPAGYARTLLAWIFPRYRWGLLWSYQLAHQKEVVVLHVKPWPLPEKTAP